MADPVPPWFFAPVSIIKLPVMGRQFIYALNVWLKKYFNGLDYGYPVRLTPVALYAAIQAFLLCAILASYLA